MGDDPKRVGVRSLRWTLGGLAGLLVAAGAVRAGLYLVYAARMSTFPLEAHQLESKMVLLAWRAQQGLSLYPEWRDYPHVANFSRRSTSCSSAGSAGWSGPTSAGSS